MLKIQIDGIYIKKILMSFYLWHNSDQNVSKTKGLLQ